MSAERYSRQSFLGLDAEETIARVTVAVAGLGGGGSHVVQQLAHIGFQNYVLYDGDAVEESNLNRLIGATAADALAETPKLHLAKMMIYALQPQANIRGFACTWQERPEPMRECQIVIGCVDSYKGREELEIACRRYLMHHIDIGMDVHGTETPVIGGQVIQSSPGGLCMRCMGFLTEEKLAQEAGRYGNVGPRPQVVWPNGVLASIAVGLAVDLVTNWTKKQRSHAYLVYDGNEGTVTDSITLRNLQGTCNHYSISDVGDPFLVDL
jgi:molybdopterin-synthase adenylyltransferase